MKVLSALILVLSVACGNSGTFGQKEGQQKLLHMSHIRLKNDAIDANKTAAEDPCKGIDRTRQGRVKQLQLYHISKCGGSTLNEMFRLRDPIHTQIGGLWTAKGQKAFKGEKENNCDQEYCGRKPAHVFILGTIRNPFEYHHKFSYLLEMQQFSLFVLYLCARFYLSYWMMLSKMLRLQVR